ncbi:hypothetical protein HPB52_002184 [Rhipicephalus sanguineus]|uniref:Tata box-binding protein-associated factor rna polymerase i subunit a n=1 Tax=Rhipicephalus sanguineus TaxID=34632 RepID=A0A9D4PFG8_RHISA|nr:hypothetical protein HPB52_002184 [Rhipicephalus sanguineus]
MDEHSRHGTIVFYEMKLSERIDVKPTVEDWRPVNQRARFLARLVQRLCCQYRWQTAAEALEVLLDGRYPADQFSYKVGMLLHENLASPEQMNFFIRHTRCLLVADKKEMALEYIVYCLKRMQHTHLRTFFQEHLKVDRKMLRPNEKLDAFIRGYLGLLDYLQWLSHTARSCQNELADADTQAGESFEELSSVASALDKWRPLFTPDSEPAAVACQETMDVFLTKTLELLLRHDRADEADDIVESYLDSHSDDCLHAISYAQALSQRRSTTETDESAVSRRMELLQKMRMLLAYYHQLCDTEEGEDSVVECLRLLADFVDCPDNKDSVDAWRRLCYITVHTGYSTARAGRRASALAAPCDFHSTAPPPTPALVAIATDHECFVGGVHFPMASVKKRKNLDFATKLKATQRVEAGKKSSAVADNIGKPRSMLSTLLKNEADIEAKAAEQRTSEDCDDERIDDAFRVLSSLFPAAVPTEVSADDFVEADCNVQADAQADSSSGDKDRPDEAAATSAYSAAEVAAAFGLIRRCCGDMEKTGMSHLDSLDKIEATVRDCGSRLWQERGDYWLPYHFCPHLDGSPEAWLLKAVFLQALGQTVGKAGAYISEVASRLLERDAELLEKFRAAQEQMLRAPGLDHLFKEVLQAACLIAN